MKTFPNYRESDRLMIGFEIRNAFISSSRVERLLATIVDVSSIRRRRLFTKWDEIHLGFRYREVECVVWEPFGDNSRYWIGAEDIGSMDMAAIELVFRGHRPSLWRSLLGRFFFPDRAIDRPIPPRPQSPGRPRLPLRVQFSDGEVCTYASLEEAALDLEFFDSEQPDDDDPVRVTDSLGRVVRLRIEACGIVECNALPESSASQEPLADSEA